MPVINSIAAEAETLKEWRRHLHRNPELLFECVKTAAFVVDKLKSFGISEIHEGIATTGVVAIIEGRGPGRTIGLRADMDALPMDDLSGTEHASTVPGVAHTCGHDGHTTMLLGAAKYLAETRNFAGRVALIFQPAEEGGGGGKVMVEEGMMDRFGIEEVYGIHNAPGDPEGHILTAPGALMASADEFRIEITGVGGHGAEPAESVDPIPAAAAMVGALQTIVSRNVSALDRLVVSVTEVHAGTAHNIIPGTAWLGGTVRSFRPEIRDLAERRMREIAETQAAVFGCTATVLYERGYPPLVNHAEQARFAAEVAREVVGADKVDADTAPIMPAEDFSYMLEARPGAYLFLGQGDTPNCHHPKYDFNDAIAPTGASFLARLVERALPIDNA
ncbi:MAG: M20 aminoacylase family protein [Salipiger thiooxidans]|uniref:M20 aminoacylase family protein n=1 Tax=Salipiger thiooxidans TaxID=282683 RepID=UPI001CD743A2|nr:M20 aminoacylase family protein [Salipiger thiooxidans]MBR9836796.1 amidohydrolase [Paracoccaceae bacterium]MCA0847726.1 M20 family metallopeptidase [Salipiger thiooxidans]